MTAFLVHGSVLAMSHYKTIYTRPKVKRLVKSSKGYYIPAPRPVKVNDLRDRIFLVALLLIGAWIIGGTAYILIAGL